MEEKQRRMEREEGGRPVRLRKDESSPEYRLSGSLLAANRHLLCLPAALDTMKGKQRRPRSNNNLSPSCVKLFMKSNTVQAVYCAAGLYTDETNTK